MHEEVVLGSNIDIMALCNYAFCVIDFLFCMPKLLAGHNQMNVLRYVDKRTT